MFTKKKCVFLATVRNFLVVCGGKLIKTNIEPLAAAKHGEYSISTFIISRDNSTDSVSNILENITIE